MPGKARVHELAKELGMDSKTVLSWLKDNGEFVKSASSTVEAPVARKLREAFPAAKTAPASVIPATARNRALESSGVRVARGRHLALIVWCELDENAEVMIGWANFPALLAETRR